MGGVRALVPETQRAASLCPPCEDPAMRQPGSRWSPGTVFVWTLILDLLGSRMVRNKLLLFKSVCDVSLQ